MLDTSFPPAITFTPCRIVEADARLVMTWRNDPDTLAASFHSAPKVWDEFWPEYRDDYFATAVPPVFALADGVAIGFLRFEPVRASGVGGVTVDISINLDPARRGQGLGRAVLTAAQDYLSSQGVDAILAAIKPDNSASIAAFADAGFRHVSSATKQIADTGETHPVELYAANLTPLFWRRGGVFVIAEAGSNWHVGNTDGDMAMAKGLIDAAAAAGADAVKFQTYRPETTYVANAGTSGYLSDAGISADISDIFADLAMPYDMIPRLAEYCRGAGVAFMSTAFSPADFAAIDPHTPVHKIASYEISHVHLIELAARSGKPVLMSTGASTPADIAWAVDTFRAAGGRDLCLLQCTAKYPAPLTSLNLRAIAWLQRRFGVAAGLSDHSREPVAGPAAAVALGARVIEKHFTLDNDLPGPDHAFAVTPDQLTAMVGAIRAAESTLGDGVKTVQPEERELAAFARRGLQATRDIAAGETLREGDNFAILRPGGQPLGAHPKHLAAIDGRRVRAAIALGAGIAVADCE